MKATQTELIEHSFFELMKDVGTSIPAAVQSFDGDTQQAVIQVGIERIDINGVTFTPPPIIQCPVMFPGGKWCVEYQIDKGDEGLLIISQRCMDAWKDQGGVAPNPIGRFHDMQDALFIPGFRSQKNKLTDFQNNGIRLRDQSGENYVWLKNSGDIEMKGASFQGEFTGGFNVDSTSMTHNGTNIGDDHDHDDTGTYNVSGTPVTGTSGVPL